MEKLVYGGDGLARLDGRVVLVPYVLPGERVLAQAEQEKPGLVRARAVQVLEPAPERIAALCPVFERCGGCHYQQAPYEFQLAAKRAILAEELRRLGKITPPDEITTLSGEPWHYRNRVQLHIAGGKLGYWEARSHKLCPIDQCPIASPRVNEVIRILGGMLSDPRWPHFVKTLEVFSDEQQVQLNVTESDRPVARRFFEWCWETIPGLVDGPLDYQGRFRVSGNSFFQANRFLMDRLVETALEGAQGETAVDLYAGVGLFSLALAKRFKDVTAVESGISGVRDLRFNAERASLQNVRAEQKTSEDYLAGLAYAPDFLLLDPPRVGLGKEVVKRLIELQPREIVIVACDPATLARDLAGLLGGGFRTERMVMIDLFPQTYHLETVVHLRSA